MKKTIRTTFPSRYPDDESGCPVWILNPMIASRFQIRVYFRIQSIALTSLSGVGAQPADPYQAGGGSQQKNPKQLYAITRGDFVWTYLFQEQIERKENEIRRRQSL